MNDQSSKDTPLDLLTTSTIAQRVLGKGRYPLLSFGNSANVLMMGVNPKA